MDPARMFKESLTSRPELENSQGQKQTLRRVRVRSVHTRDGGHRSALSQFCTSVAFAMSEVDAC